MFSFGVNNYNARKFTAENAEDAEKILDSCALTEVAEVFSRNDGL